MKNAHNLSNVLKAEINTIWVVVVVVVDKRFQVILQKTEHYCVYHHRHQAIPRLASHSGLGILTVVFRKVESIPINIVCPRILCLSWPTPSPSENPPLPHTFPPRQLHFQLLLWADLDSGNAKRNILLEKSAILLHSSWTSSLVEKRQLTMSKRSSI